MLALSKRMSIHFFPADADRVDEALGLVDGGRVDDVRALVDGGRVDETLGLVDGGRVDDVRALVDVALAVVVLAVLPVHSGRTLVA